MLKNCATSSCPTLASPSSFFSFLLTMILIIPSILWGGTSSLFFSSLFLFSSSDVFSQCPWSIFCPWCLQCRTSVGPFREYFILPRVWLRFFLCTGGSLSPIWHNFVTVSSLFFHLVTKWFCCQGRFLVLVSFAPSPWWVFYRFPSVIRLLLSFLCLPVLYHPGVDPWFIPSRGYVFWEFHNASIIVSSS